MSKKRRKILIINKNIVGNFRLPEMKIRRGQQGKRLKLCTVEEADYKWVNGKKVKRSENERQTFVARLWLLKEEELKKRTRERIKKTSIKSVMKKWLEHQRAFRSKKTADDCERTVSMYLRVIGDHPIEDFEYKHNDQLLMYLSAARPSPGQDRYSVASQNRYMRTLQALFNWAYQRDLSPRVIRLKKPAIAKKPTKAFSQDDLKKIGEHICSKMRNANKEYNIRRYRCHYRIYMIAVYTLMRVGAIWSLKIDHIDLKTAVIKIRDNPELGWKNKKNKQRDKPIHPYLLDFLRDDLTTRGENERYYLDNGKGQTYYASADSLTTAFKKNIIELGIDPQIKPLHGIRAAGTTQLLREGVDIRSVQILLDHEDISTTARYDDRENELQKTALDKLPKLH